MCFENVINLKMQVLHSLKFSFNRSHALSAALIHMQQITLLGVITAANDHNIYKQVFEIFGITDIQNIRILLGGLILNILTTLLLVVVAGCQVQQLKRLIPALSIFVKLFPYLLSVACFNYCFSALFSSQDLMVRITAITNLPFLFAYLILHQFINQSLKFRQVDFCNQKISSYTQIILIPTALLILHIVGPFYAILCCSLRAAYSLLTFFGACEYMLPQKLKTFYALLTFYLSFIRFLINFNIVLSESDRATAASKIGILVAGASVSWLLSSQVVAAIWRSMLRRARGSGERSEGQNSDNQQAPLDKIQNEVSILTQAYLQRQKHLKQEQNSYSYFWREFNQIVFSHKLKCNQSRCICKNPKSKNEHFVEGQVYVNNILKRLTSAIERLGKEIRLKILNIYLLIEIAKKPLKGYFQLIVLKKEKMPAKMKLEVDDLVSIARNCFDQIFYKNKVQNQMLDLLKVIRFEQNTKSLQEDLRTTIMTSSAFLELFIHSSLKICQVQSEAERLVAMKKGIEQKIESLVLDSYDNPSVNFCIFIFYRFLEPYRSREIEFKKLAGQQALKKRLLLKAQGQTFSSNTGIIYIDLAEDRGRIKKITRSICQKYGYSREDMVGFNINLFMPTIYGKNHAKFLSNFIDKGRIKLLKEKERIVFGKNKRKFIFPVNARLKAEHLLDNEFGASAIFTFIDTNSEFMIVGKQGRIEEISEGLYQRIFSKCLRAQVQKMSRFCAYKFLPGLNQQINDWDQNQASKIYEGLMIFTDQQEYLMQKFRYARDATYSSMGSKSKSSSMSLVEASTESLTMFSKSERYEFMCDLFKAFLMQINPNRLKAFKVSYKYSRVKTSEFEVELIEIITTKEQLFGKQYLRQLLNELNNVADMFQILDDHSPISQHLLKLQEQMERESGNKLPGALSLEFRVGNRQVFQETRTIQDPTIKESEMSEEEFVQDNEEKPLVNHHASSEAGSVTGNTESQSKKQLLINAFNASEDAIPTIAIICAAIAVISLLALLLTMTLLQLSSIDKTKTLWVDSSYLMSLRLAFEFRVSLAEIASFGKNLNFSVPNGLILQQQQLNQEMVVLSKNLITNTYQSDLTNNPFLFKTPLYDPHRQITYNATFPQSVTKLTQLFTQPSQENQDTVRYNYQGIHQNFTDFYLLRNKFYKKQSDQSSLNMKILLAVYEVLISLVALSAIPIYVYFKRQELGVRTKLAFMSQREIRKAIGRFSLIQQFFKTHINKNSINKLQYQIAERKHDKDQENSVSKVIKITSQSEDYKMFSNPWTYFLLFAFIGFFSNLPISLFTIFTKTNTFFLNSLSSHKISNDLEIKTPLLVNVYMSNLNRALEGARLWNFTASTIDETQQGYYQLIQRLSKPQYDSNSIASLLSYGVTIPICQQVPCLENTNLSMQDIAQGFKQRFSYWDLDNGIIINHTTVLQWVANNHIDTFISQLGYVLILSLRGEQQIDSAFDEQQSSYLKIVLLLGSILIPINVILLIIILRKYLMQVNQMVRSAQQIYMNFPVQVLIENTYLTSYFTSKIKSDK